MNASFNMSTRKSLVRALYRVFADAALGAACAGLYGFAFGGIGALAQHESQRLLSITCVFALCGAIAGLALGAFNMISNANVQSSESSSAKTLAGKDKTQATAVRPLAAISDRRAQSSHAAV